MVKINNKKKGLFLVLAILAMALILIYFRFNSVKTEQKVMYESEIMERKNQIKYLMENGYRDEMYDIYFEYSNITDKMVPVEGKVNFDYAIVKQRYKVDKKLGWMPVGMPEIQIFEKKD